MDSVMLNHQDQSSAKTDIQRLPPAQRMSLRAGPYALDALSEALGIALPRTPLQSSINSRRAALWLGPDEWLILDLAGDSLFDDVKAVDKVHAATDISHRNVAFAVTGSGGEAVLNAGCPLDLSLQQFAVGQCARTVFGKAEIILWRRDRLQFHVEVWRSFSEYVHKLLFEAARSHLLCESDNC